MTMLLPGTTRGMRLIVHEHHRQFPRDMCLFGKFSRQFGEYYFSDYLPTFRFPVNFSIWGPNPRIL